jgi:hypothetical protein
LGELKRFSAIQLIAILSCFTNITVPEDKRMNLPYSRDGSITEYISNLKSRHQRDMDLEIKESLDTGSQCDMNYDIMDYMLEWCECSTEKECLELLQKIQIEKEIFLGEFIKAILKINNIGMEFEKVAENIGDIAFLSILKEIPIRTLKYVATNQSLYV